MKMNLPNKLTVLRLLMVPTFVVILIVSDAIWAHAVAMVLFIAASVTDMLDGKIARRQGLVTDFGKFLDPLADKFMVIGATMAILFRLMCDDTPNRWFTILFFCAVLTVIFRELAITSIRLVVSGSKNIVLAANFLGKVKTCTQIACVIACLAERIFYRIPALDFLNVYLPLSVISTVLMLVMTLWSGINYIISYWKYMDPQK